jgi:hypothetical protein
MWICHNRYISRLYCILIGSFLTPNVVRDLTAAVPSSYVHVALCHWLIVTNLWSPTFIATVVMYPTFKRAVPRLGFPL